MDLLRNYIRKYIRNYAYNCILAIRILEYKLYVIIIDTYNLII